MSQPISLQSIAVVQSRFDSNTPPETMRGFESRLVFEPGFEPGLLGLKPGMDILVLFFLHNIDSGKVKLQLRPRHNPENPLRGVFATRSQYRPNPIGATVAQVQAVAGNVLIVTGLDALNGTPVLDVKPYTTWFDADAAAQNLEVVEVSSLNEARQAIDRLDTEIIRLLGNRAGYVRQVVKFKQTADEVRAPGRYAEVMRERRKLAEAADLNPDIIESMYKLLVDNFIKEEMQALGLEDA